MPFFNLVFTDPPCHNLRVMWFNRLRHITCGCALTGWSQSQTDTFFPLICTTEDCRLKTVSLQEVRLIVDRYEYHTSFWSYVIFPWHVVPLESNQRTCLLFVSNHKMSRFWNALRCTPNRNLACFVNCISKLSICFFMWLSES